MAQPTIAELQLRLTARGLNVPANLHRALARVGSAEIRRQLDAQARSILGIEKAMVRAGKAGGAFSNFLKHGSRATIVARGLFDGFTAVGGAITDALQPLREFQHNMAKVQAKGELSIAERVQAETAVKGMVGKTKFGAVEASEAAVGLAAAGQGKNLGQALPTVLKFAQANDITPERSTEILLGVMGQMGKKITDLEGIGDMLTRTDQLSVLNVSQIFDTLKYVGPLARDAKMPLEELLAMISTLGDQGINASKAGTGIRNLMTSLTKDPRRGKQVNKMLGELGLKRQDLQAGLNNAPQFLSELDKKMEDAGWTPAKRMAFNAAAFGQYGMTTSSALLAGSQALSKNPDGTANTQITVDRAKIAAAKLNHTLEKQAQLMGETLESRIARVTAKFELLKINLGEKMLPTINAVLSAIDGWATDGLNSEDLSKAMEKISTALVATLPVALKATEAGLALVIPGVQLLAGGLENLAVGLGAMGVIDYNGAGGRRDVKDDQGIRDQVRQDAIDKAYKEANEQGRTLLPNGAEEAARRALAMFDAEQRRMSEPGKGPMSVDPAKADKSLVDIVVKVDGKGDIKAFVEKLTKGTNGPNISLRTGAPTP